MRAASVNNTDIDTRTGWYSKSVRGDTVSSAAGTSDMPDERDAGLVGHGLADPPDSGRRLLRGDRRCRRAPARMRIGERVLVRSMQSTGAGEEAFGSECDGAFAEFTKTFAADALPAASARPPISSPSVAAPT